ncbi:MAG: acyltransferase, partial [Dyella sp.]
VLSFGLGLLVLAGADRTSAIGRWTVPGAGWIAAMSYSLYLSHKLALHAVQVGIVLPWQLHGLRAFACYAVGVLLLGGALHYLIERPFLQWRDRRKVAPFSQAAGAAV